MPRRTAAAAAALALVASGCGDEPEPVRAAGGRVAIALDDFLLRPQSVSARPGRLSVRVVNRGRIAHNLHVRRGKRHPIEVRTLLPGRSAQGSGVLARGDYTLVCTVANHEELGMYGTLTVR
jgi:plastocyanin